MSTFQGGQFPTRVRRQSTPELFGRQQTVAGQTPAAGVGTMRPGGLDAATAQRLQSMQQWLGMTGQVAGQLDRRQAIRTQEQETLMRGQAKTDSDMMLPRLNQQLNDGELDHLFDGDGEVEEAVLDFVDEQIDDEMPESYRDAYRRMVAPRLLTGVIDRERQVIDTARGENSQLATEAGIAADSPDQLGEAMDAWMDQNPGSTRSDAMAAVAIPAARSHAQLGPAGRDQLEMVMSVIGDRFPGEQREIRDTFEGASSQLQRRRDENLRRAMPELTRGEPTPELLNHRLGQRFDWLGDAERELVVEDYTRDRISSAARLGQPEKVFELADRLSDTDSNRAFIQQQLERTLPVMREQFHQERLAETVQDMLPMAMDWRKGGGLPEAWAQMGDTITFDVGQGVEIDVTRQQVEQTILPAARERLIEEVRDQMPDASDAEVGAVFEQRWLSFLGGNGMTDPQLKQRLGGIAASMGGVEHEDQVPERAMAALDFYQRSRNAQPRVVNAHLGGEDDIELLRRATRIQQTQDVSPGQALMRAERNIHTAAPAGATTAMIDEAVQNVMFVDRIGPFNEEAVNVQHVYDYLRTAVEDGVQDTGYSAEAVLEGVLEEFQNDFTMINNHWVNTSTIGAVDVEKIPFDALGTTIAEQFTAANPQEGYEAGDLTLAPDGVNPNQWRLRDSRGYVVPDAPVFAMQDIIELGGFLTGEQAFQSNELTIRKQAERRIKQMRMTRIQQWKSEAVRDWHQDASLVDRLLKRGLGLAPEEDELDEMMADVPTVDELVEQRMAELKRPAILDDPVLGEIARHIRELPEREKRERTERRRELQRRFQRRRNVEDLSGDMGFGQQRRSN